MIIFGLGNPGSIYRSTRHNVGYRVAERLARRFKKRFRTIPGYKIAVTKQKHVYIHIVKPICWMNQSGISVKNYLEKRPEEFLIVIDDVNLPLGRMRLRSAGSDGGHQGLRSVIKEIGREDFPRLRVGIGHKHGDLAEYVLSRFTRREKQVLDCVINKAAEGIIVLLAKGLSKAQNLLNSVDHTEDE
jgi:PTH1 family peptidyl-tRNA hydrolase